MVTGNDYNINYQTIPTGVITKDKREYNLKSIVIPKIDLINFPETSTNQPYSITLEFDKNQNNFQNEEFLSSSITGHSVDVSKDGSKISFNFCDADSFDDNEYDIFIASNKQRLAISDDDLTSAIHVLFFMWNESSLRVH